MINIFICHGVTVHIAEKVPKYGNMISLSNHPISNIMVICINYFENYEYYSYYHMSKYMIFLLHFYTKTMINTIVLNYYPINLPWCIHPKTQ